MCRFLMFDVCLFSHFNFQLYLQIPPRLDFLSVYVRTLFWFLSFIFIFHSCSFKFSMYYFIFNFLPYSCSVILGIPSSHGSFRIFILDFLFIFNFVFRYRFGWIQVLFMFKYRYQTYFWSLPSNFNFYSCSFRFLKFFMFFSRPILNFFPVSAPLPSSPRPLTAPSGFFPLNFKIDVLRVLFILSLL